MHSRTERIALACFLGAALFGGGNAVGIRFSNRELDPLWGAALRFGLAALVLLAVMAVLRRPFPRGRALGGAILFGILNFGVTFALAYYALVRIHAGFGQTMLALVPLVTLLLAVAQRQERMRGQAVLGTLLAVGGVAVMVWSPGTSVPLLSFLAVLGSVFSFAQATVLVRRLPPVPPIEMNAVGMAAGAAVLLAGSLISGDRIVLPGHATTWLALGYLVVAGSVLVFVFYLVVLKYWSASRASYIFVLAPVVTIALSNRLDHEPITARLLIGAPLILAGVHLGALRRGQ